MSEAGDVRFGREAAKGFCAKVGMYLFGFVATAYFARVLGPASFGGYFLLLSIVAFVNRVPQGIGGACQKRISEVDSADEELLGIVVGTTVAVGLVVAALAFVGRDLLTTYTGLAGAGFLAVLLAATASLYVPLLFLLCGLGRFGDKEWVELGQDLVKRPLQVVFVSLGFGAAGMAFGRIGAILVCLPIVFVLLGIRPAIPSRATISSVWTFARPNVASNVVGKAYTRFDVFLLGIVGATAAVGYYEVALALTGLGTLISGVVMDGLLSKVSALDSEGRRVEESVATTLSYTSVIAIPVFVVVVVLGDPIVRTVYGSEYVAALPFVLVLAFYRIVQVQRETLDSALKGLDRPDLVFKSTTVAVILNFAVGVPLLVLHGPMGVVVATAVAELTQWRLLHRFLSEVGCDVPCLPSALGKQAVAAVLMGGVLWPATTLVTYSYTPSNLVGLILLGTSVYATGLIAMDETVRQLVQRFFVDLQSVVGNGASPWPSD